MRELAQHGCVHDRRKPDRRPGTWVDNRNQTEANVIVYVFPLLPSTPTAIKFGTTKYITFVQLQATIRTVHRSSKIMYRDRTSFSLSCLLRYFVLSCSLVPITHQLSEVSNTAVNCWTVQESIIKLTVCASRFYKSLVEFSHDDASGVVGKPIAGWRKVEFLLV